MGTKSPEERVIELMADPVNRSVVTILEEADGPLALDDLASALVSRDVGLVPDDDYERALERTLLSLHHDHLPKLAGAGVIAYDVDDRLVRTSGESESGPEWVDLDLIDDLLARLGPDDDAVGTVEGRGAAIEHGRRLADRADEELFLLYVSDDLLEADCLGHASAAIDRGVDVLLGSRNPDVRGLVRRQLPEATVWEPQFDWTTAPSAYPAVGRLVLVDREAVMLGILEGADQPHERAERALVGEGRDNPLVVMVRELLGSRLDHLDYQSTDLRQHLSF